MPKKKDTGFNSPARNAKELTANCGGMPAKKTVEQIDKINMPPKSPPTGSAGSKSVRV